jgi:hypothetical protein
MKNLDKKLNELTPSFEYDADITIYVEEDGIDRGFWEYTLTDWESIGKNWNSEECEEYIITTIKELTHRINRLIKMVTERLADDRTISNVDVDIKEIKTYREIEWIEKWA